MATRLRVFISSPGDVRDAREVAARTVEKIAPDYLRHFGVEPYMWETEALLASGHFQDAIEPPSQFDIVTLILWSRLGTLLPEKTALRRYTGIDGRSPVTGTEWEYEDALSAAHERGVPDLLVYRSRKSAHVDAWNAERRNDELEQLAALDRFWTRHFADRATFIGAYHEFVDLEDLATVFEAHLRRLIDHRVSALTPDATGAHVRGRVWTKSPFRGLEAFDYEHAPIFFGREEAVGRALGQLINNADAGKAFLLVLGASGSGKSSLVKAGLAPRLGLPRRVVGKSFLRRVTFRPSDRTEGEELFDALARALATTEGPGVGLPELGRPDRLAGVLRDGPEHAHAILANALDGLSQEARASGHILLHEEGVLLLVLDQLEELYTDQGITPDQRRRFTALIGALSRCGRVWIVATMRSDLWHRAAETPELVALAEGLGRCDLLAPSPAEISQMIRLPAEAAGLSFEHSAEDGVPLNDRISEEAAQSAGVLPLLSYLLEQLYQADALEAGRTILSYASYLTVGRLKGAIAARAETILAQETEPVRAALRQVLFALVQFNPEAGGGGTFTARRALLESFEEDGPARTLIEVLLEPKSRLLIADADGEGQAIVRVAHEALLTEWTQARECIAEDAALLAIRRTTEERYARWLSLGSKRPAGLAALFSREPGLLAGADLNDARRLDREARRQLPPGLVQYIARSDRLDKRARQEVVVLSSGLAAALAGLAVFAAAMGLLARQNADTAKVEALEPQVINAQRDGDDALRTHNPKTAIVLYGQAVSAAASMVKLEPANPQWLLNLASVHASLGYALLKRGLGGDAQLAKSEFALAQQAVEGCARVDEASPILRTDRITLERQLQPFLQQQ